ncbi:2-phosphosulfolactate phosphatase [Nocardia fusca]|uniref:2-phosphosulfolactate phosphatase n=1 Tax=Nocardia fusca TaxID=941183 RepID=UPI0007A75358|nr:2-phosphosulfolactate phosphatase [Nocardia fusca]
MVAVFGRIAAGAGAAAAGTALAERLGDHRIGHGDAGGGGVPAQRLRGGRLAHPAGLGVGRPAISIIAAGERWPGADTLRPAAEDWIGAGAVVSALAAAGAGPLSPEAAAAAALHHGIGDVARYVTDCASGRELAAAGFAEDVAIAVEIDAGTAVPVRTDGVFTAAEEGARGEFRPPRA